MSHQQYGELAYDHSLEKLPLRVLRSNAGFYIGTFSPELGPISRESQEYWRERHEAEHALESGHWTQRSFL